MIYLIIPIITILYMAGGQWEKSLRRMGVPVSSFIFYLLRQIESDKKKERWKAFGFLLLIPFLMMGYGENSWLRKHMKKEWAIRLVYAVFLSLPFLLWFPKYLICLPLLIGAYQVRAGKITTIGSFDILIEDICRGMALGISIVLCLR